MDNQDFCLFTDALAKVPEHSISLMRAMSRGEPLRLGNYLFFSAGDWLIAVAYPLEEEYSHASFTDALEKAIQKTGAGHCFAIGPQFPDQLASRIVKRDRYHVLSANAPVPRKLVNPVKHARGRLEVTEGSAFTGAHRKLWNEFLGRQTGPNAMPPHIGELYVNVPQAMSKTGGTLRLLDARDEAGNVVACLLLDYAAGNFVSYILGAHSREHYVPHAADLLFAEMIARARQAGKKFIHLGLGVNDGILRFKTKWGAKPSWPYVMAQWETGTAANVDHRDDIAEVGLDIARAVLATPAISARQYLASQPSAKPYAMLWRVEKNGRVSWIGGTAHFFCHSFEPSFRRLFRNVEDVIFEGPLDAEFMARVDAAGKTPMKGQASMLELMTQDEVEKLERVVIGPRDRLSRMLRLASGKNVDVRWLLANAQPWHAFFSLWTCFLERKGWHESVDMEAWRLAREMDRNIIAMESMEEQLESLGSLPVERVLRFFRACGGWNALARHNRRAYLAGDLEKMMGSSAEFPTRTEHVVGRRDQRFRERMRPYMEKGNCAVFVGTAHMVNLRHMLVEDGFSVRQVPFGIWPRVHLGIRRIFRPDEEVTW